MGRDIEGNTMKMKARIILATQDQVEVEGKNPKLRKKNELKEKWENRPLTRKEMKKYC